jgi:trehalose 6-phosphate synthase/phosphatase
VEVRLTWANKLEVLHRLAADLPKPDFWLALGDDRSDEDLFERLPSEAWTVHVGGGPSLARFRLKDPEAVRHFLQALADSEEGLTPEPAAQLSTQR